MFARSRFKFFAVISLLTLLLACTESGFSGSGGQKDSQSQKSSDKQKRTKGKGNNKVDSSQTDDIDSDDDTSRLGNQSDSDADTGTSGTIENDSDSGSGDNDSKNTNNARDPVTQRFSGSSASAKLPVDIVFAMDTSGSMDDEKNMLETHMSTFVSEFQRKAAGLDFQIFFIGVDFTFPNVGSGLNLVPIEVSSHDALSVFMSFFNGGGKSVRSESIKQLVVVTDDEAEDSASDFKSFVNSNPVLKGKTKFNGLIGLPNSQQNDQCTVESVGEQYITLANDSEFKGLIQDLCIQDWGSLLKTLASNIITQSKSNAVFQLDSPADSSQPIVIKVGGVQVGSDVANYQEKDQSIVFLPGKEPASGTDVTVTYYPM